MEKLKKFKVVCIDNKLDNMTYGKVYDVIDIDTTDYYIVHDDFDYKSVFLYSRFIDLNEWRIRQLDLILI